MARPKAKAAPRFVEPEDESQDPEDQQRLEAEEPDEEPEATGKRMSKTDAIRAAMAEGIESPGDGVDFIKRRFGLEMSRQHFSATRSKLKSSEGQGEEGDLLSAMETMKPLVAALGAEKVKRIADLLG